MASQKAEQSRPHGRLLREPFSKTCSSFVFPRIRNCAVVSLDSSVFTRFASGLVSIINDHISVHLFVPHGDVQISHFGAGVYAFCIECGPCILRNVYSCHDEFLLSLLNFLHNTSSSKVIFNFISECMSIDIAVAFHRRKTKIASPYVAPITRVLAFHCSRCCSRS